ncbi:sigma-70 family RNA polymerase sigma factor [Novilysobacter erysipheiresistens]|uniref:Sigma-70 family RNA polymerase sigma factor n=1 Tax=Novilysobacter erysipheiresistens TaxID=1749332 RepID=A0ABU7Z0J9_9GAMM
MIASVAMEAELWCRYSRDRDTDAWNQLATLYGPWAASVARSVHRRVWAYPVDLEDFVQNARVGLLEAMSRYDPDRGIAFQAYAKPRIRGAVFNGLKAVLGDRPTPRDEARLKARLHSLQRSHDGESDAFDTVVNTIAELGLGLLLDEVVQSQAASGTGEGYAYARASEVEARLAAAVERLPQRLALIIRAHYYEHLQFQELAATLGVTKGRVSQLHRAGLERLRMLVQDLP